MMSGHVQGSVLKLFVFIFNPCLIYLCRCWIYIYLLLSVMAKLRGVSSTSGNSIKRRSSNLAKPKLYLVRTSNGYADLVRPILEYLIRGVGSTRLYAKGILIVSRRVCHDRYRSCLSLFTVVIINIINIIQSNIVYIIDTPYKLYHQPIHHY